MARKVIKHGPDICFVWLGEGALLGKVRQRVKEMGLNDRVIFKSHSENIADYYSQAMVYFQPSLLESHGMQLLKLWPMGCPVSLRMQGAS